MEALKKQIEELLNRASECREKGLMAEREAAVLHRASERFKAAGEALGAPEAEFPAETPNLAAAVFAFAAWLTTRKEPVVFCSTACAAAELAGAFCSANGLPDPRGIEALCHPKESTAGDSKTLLDIQKDLRRDEDALVRAGVVSPLGVDGRSAFETHAGHQLSQRPPLSLSRGVPTVCRRRIKGPHATS